MGVAPDDAGDGELRLMTQVMGSAPVMTQVMGGVLDDTAIEVV